MRKHLTKSFMLRAFALLGAGFLLYCLWNPNSSADPYACFADTNRYIPIGDRVAVYRFAEYRYGLGAKYIVPHTHGGVTYMLPPLTFPHSIIKRDGLGYDLYEFSHFIIKSDRLRESNIAVYNDNPLNFTCGYDPSLYDFSPYVYGDMLKQVYNVSSADGIASVDISFMDYSENRLTDKADIAEFYDVIANMECVDHDYRDTVPGTDITVSFKNGSSAKGLRYSRAHGAIYQIYMADFEDTAFAAYLTEAQQAIIERLISGD